MFDTCYHFHKVNNEGVIQQSEPHILSKEVFRFTTVKGNCYLVRIHRYSYNAYVVKFHLRDHKKDSKKYHRILNYFESQGVLRTVIEICIKVLGDNPKASFAFIGVPKISPQDGKSEPDTMPKNQRFRVYKKLAETFLGTVQFDHIEAEEMNAYLLINRSDDSVEDLPGTIKRMFIDVYQDYGQLLAP